MSNICKRTLDCKHCCKEDSDPLFSPVVKFIHPILSEGPHGSCTSIGIWNLGLLCLCIVASRYFELF